MTEKELQKLKEVDVLSNPSTVDEFESKTDLLENSRLILKLPHHIFNALSRVAEHKQQTIESYASQLLSESLETQVGAAWITGPSSVSGTRIKAKKVSGPTYSVSRG